MPGPSTKKVKRAQPAPTFRPHPDDEAEVRAGLDDAERGDVLNAEESAAYLQSLLGENERPERK